MDHYLLFHRYAAVVSNYISLYFTSKIPALRAGILLGISYRIQIGLAYCNGPKGAGRGSEKPACTTG